MASKAVYIVLLLFSINELQTARAVCNVTAVSSQLDTLLAEYDRESSPDLPVHVEVNFNPRHVNVLEKSSSVKLLADLRMSWKDTRLAWNATDWGCESALTSAERLWLPDITIMNAASSDSGDSTMRARLNFDGSILWISRACGEDTESMEHLLCDCDVLANKRMNLLGNGYPIPEDYRHFPLSGIATLKQHIFGVDVTVPISMELTAWPSDVQTCTVKYGSRAHTTEELVIDVKQFKYATIFESSSWDLVNMTFDIEKWSWEGESRDLAAWTVKMQRHAPAHAVATGAALVATALMLVASIFLEPSSRAPLLACASFTAALWLMSALVRLPPSGSTPTTMSLMCALCISGAFWCACAAVVLRVAKVESSAPHAVHGMVAAASRWCKLLPLEGSGAGEVSTWAAAARLIDLVLLAGLALTVFIILCIYI